MIYDRGINNNTLKQRNRGLILKLIATSEHHISRVELARLSGLTKMSVTNIVSELIEAGYVQEVETKEGTRTVGRSPIGLDIAPNAPKIIGVMLQREMCEVAICDLKTNILSLRQHYWTKCNAEILLETICMLIDQLMQQEKDIVGIGVGAVGQVDIIQGMILNPTNFFGIHHYPLGSLMEERYQIPVHVDNQINCAAMGEIYYGHGKQYRDFVYLSMGTGIGTSMVKDGEVYHSAEGLGTEAGHISINYKGPYCNCGNRGCLELYAGSRAIERKVLEETGEKLDFAAICLRSKERYYSDVLDDLVEKLSTGLIGLVNVLNPQAIIMGRLASEIPQRHLHSLEAVINSRKLSKDFSYCHVVNAMLGETGGLRGCAAVIADQMYQGNYLFRLEN